MRLMESSRRANAFFWMMDQTIPVWLKIPLEIIPRIVAKLRALQPPGGSPVQFAV